jgi:hypothetical protein
VSFRLLSLYHRIAVFYLMVKRMVGSCSRSGHMFCEKGLLIRLHGARGRVVVEALCYKPEGRGIETQ